MSILTPLQTTAADFIASYKGITDVFYWTGGTVLSEFYLKHRLSEDIDLFSEQEFDVSPLRPFVQTLAEHLSAESISYSNFLGLHTFILKFPDSDLKIDFNYYPFPRIQSGSKYKLLTYDSLDDIVANKLQTIGTQPRSRDFVDLYCVSQYKEYDFSQMMRIARAKFDWYIDPLQYATQFRKALEPLDEVPLLLQEFDTNSYRDFYRGILASLTQETLQ